MLARKYEMPWRPAYEMWAASAWLVGVVFFAYMGVKGNLRPAAGLPLALAALAMALLRAHQGLDILVKRASLSGRAMQVISTRRLAALTSTPDSVFLGFGFEWLPVHSQRLYELSKVHYKEYQVSPLLLRALGYTVKPQPDSEIGVPYIHGVELQERPLYRPLQNFVGGLLLVGTTQSGKGVALSSFLTQAIRRGDVVIFIDPKNSERLKRVVRRACADYREPDTYLECHPAFPERGVRLDFLFNWQKPTEVASRLQSIMPVDTGGAFAAFSWDAVNVVVQGVVYIEDRPNLMKLTRYIEGGIESLLQAALARFYDEHLPGHWREAPEMRELIGAATKGQIKRPSDVTTAQLLAYVVYYEQRVAQPRREKVIDSMIRVFRHNREHYQKITANLLPVLSMLTSGDLGRTLSPDPFDLDDKRPIMNFEKIERGAHVLVLCTDSLPDPAVASAIAALAIADLAARAGMRYNLGIKARLTLVVDEMANVINRPLIEILNKGAEGGINTICAMQTLGDLAARLGSIDAARMALGNLNNLIALRSKDRPTQDFVAETFGKTGIHMVRVGLNEGADAHVGDWSTGRSVQVSESMEDRVPVDMLGKLPDLQYFGSVGARLVKGRFTILDPDSEDAAPAA